MQRIIGLIFMLFGFCSLQAQEGKTLGDLFKKKNKKQNATPNIIRLKDQYPATSTNENYYEAQRDPRQNPKINYLYSNLIPSGDTGKVGAFMKANQIDYNFYNSEFDPVILHVIKTGTPQMLYHFLSNGSNSNLRTYYLSFGYMNMATGTRESTPFYSEYPIKIAVDVFDTSKLNLLKEFGADLTPVQESLRKYITDPVYKAFMTRYLGSDQVAKNALWEYIHFHRKEEADIKQIEYFINKGADVNYVVEEISCLYKALERKYNNQIIKLLVEKGANVNIGEKEAAFTVGNYPICFAVKSNNLELVKLFIDKGAKTNIKCHDCYREEKNCLLQTAIKLKYNEIVEYFFSKGIY